MFEASAPTLVATLTAVIIIIVIRGAWKVVKRLWLDPKRLEKVLREQGLQANPYHLWVGDSTEMVKMQEEAISKPMMTHSNDIAPRVFSFAHHIVNKYGKNSFMWTGTIPTLILMDPEHIKNVLNKNYDFPKPHVNPIVKYIVTGIASCEGDIWAKHRKIINPAFNLAKLKTLLPSFSESCNNMISKWEKILSSSDGTCEVDVWPWLRDLSKEVISRAAFGSNHEEGRQIFELLTEQGQLIMRNFQRYHSPFWSLVNAKDNRRMKEIDRKVEESLKCIIDKREKAMKAGEAAKDDLLGMLLESNHKEIEEQGNKKNVGLSMQDVIEECKVFYVAGQETTSVLLAWTMMMLSRYPDWQARAREEVLQVFGSNQNPDFDGLSRLKIVTMIMYEVMRLYPPIVWLERRAEQDMKLGNLSIPSGVQFCIPILMVQHDQEIWGDDAKEFKPERFSEGISKAGKDASVAFFPFGWGPRICIGQNFALLKAKMALSLILQRFWFELSPSYSHAPTIVLSLQPQHGVHVILHKL